MNDTNANVNEINSSNSTTTEKKITLSKLYNK